MATCQPPTTGEEEDDGIIEVSPPTPDNPEQPTIQDRNRNYTVDSEDPTNQLDADGVVTAVPLELWEISETTVDVEGPDGATVSFPYYPYGNDQIPAQQAKPNARKYTIPGTTRTFEYSQESAIAGFEFSGRTVLPASNITNPSDRIVLVADPLTGDIVTHWELDFSFEGFSQYPEKHPPKGVRWTSSKDATADLGSQDPNEFSGLWPFTYPLVNPQATWQVGEGKVAFRYQFGTRYQKGQLGNDSSTTIQYGNDRRAEGYEPVQEVNVKVGAGNTTRTYLLEDAVYFDVPADWNTGGTLTIKPIVTDTRKVELWAYNNKSMPLGMLDSWGFSQEFANREPGVTAYPEFPFRGIQKPGAQRSQREFAGSEDNNGLRSDGKWVAGRVAFSPSGNRVAVAIPLGEYPQAFYYEADPDDPRKAIKRTVTLPSNIQYISHNAILIMERANPSANWEPYNIVCDPYYYSADFGPIQPDGSFRVWNGSSTPDSRSNGLPVFFFTDEDTMTCEWLSLAFEYSSVTASSFMDSYSIDIRAGQGDFINGPTVLSTTRRNLPPGVSNSTIVNDKGIIVDRAVHPEAKVYENLFYLEDRGENVAYYDRFHKRLYENNKFFETGFYSDLHAVMQGVELEYNGFKIVSYPDAPMVPNLSVLYHAKAGSNSVDTQPENDKRRRVNSLSRRGFANIGEVAALDSDGNIVKRWQPQDAREWAKFQADDGRIIGRPLLVAEITDPEDEVSLDTGVADLDVRSTRGLALQFGQKMVLKGSNLWIWQQYYDTGAAKDPNFTYTRLNLSRRYHATPRDSANFWESEGGGWFLIDLSTVPELNP